MNLFKKVTVVENIQIYLHMKTNTDMEQTKNSLKD